MDTASWVNLDGFETPQFTLTQAKHLKKAASSHEANFIIPPWIGGGLAVVAVVDHPVDPLLLLGVDSSMYQYLSWAYLNILGTLLFIFMNTL